MLPLMAIGAGLQGASSLYQILSAQAKKKQRAFEDFSKTQPQYAGSPELEQYYQQNLQQANTPAQQSAMYKQQQQDISRRTAQGLAGSNVARGGQALVSQLTQGATDASMRATANAEQQREQRMARLGSIVGMKSAEGQRKFEINKLRPWELQANILGAKAAGAAQQQRTGLQNLSNLASTAFQMGAYKDLYGKGGIGKNKIIGSSVESDTNPYDVLGTE
jgi:hypothetical protein